MEVAPCVAFVLRNHPSTITIPRWVESRQLGGLVFKREQVFCSQFSF